MDWPVWSQAAVLSLKAVVEFAAFLMLSRAGIWLLCLGRVNSNPVYQGLIFLTRPIQILGAGLLPARWRSQAAPWSGALLLIVFWLLLVWAKACLAGICR